MELQHHAHPKTAEVAITCMDFPDNETTTFWVGTEEGNIYSADRHNRAGSKMGMNQNDIYKGHWAFVTGLDFHPMHGPADFSDLFLSSSFDWTVKLWRARSSNKPNAVPTNITPLCSFEEADDYVLDVKWHPQHPAMFGSVDASGRLDIWNLNADADVRHSCDFFLDWADEKLDCVGAYCDHDDRKRAWAEQTGVGAQGGPPGGDGWERWEAIHLRHWRHGCPPRVGMARDAEDCIGHCRSGQGARDWVVTWLEGPCQCEGDTHVAECALSLEWVCCRIRN